jgi:hypothetical protein
MPRCAKLITLLLILVCSTSAVGAQELSEVVGRVKSIAQAKRSCWKLNRAQERNTGARKAFEQEWLCRQESVTIYFYQGDSIEAAIKMFEELRTSPVEAPGLFVESPKLGDQSSITTYSAYSRSSYVYFRKSNIVVRIDANTMRNASSALTLKNALRFAHIVEEQISQPNNSFNPTPHQRALYHLNP